MSKISKEDVLSYLESANMLEISDLISDIEEKFGVSAAAPVAVAGGVLLLLMVLHLQKRKLNLMN